MSSIYVAILQGVHALYLSPVEALLDEKTRYLNHLLEADRFGMAPEQAERTTRQIERLGDEITAIANLTIVTRELATAMLEAETDAQQQLQQQYLDLWTQHQALIERSKLLLEQYRASEALAAQWLAGYHKYCTLYNQSIRKAA